MWVSCSQDLLALACALGTLVLFLSGRRALAALAKLASRGLAWADCEALERRHNLGRGTLVVLLLVVLFAGGSFVQWFPLRGLTSDGWAQFPWYWQIIDYFWHITLPLISMALGAFATRRRRGDVVGVTDAVADFLPNR